MDSPGDCTPIQRMKRDFDDLVSKKGTLTGKSKFPRLDFDQTGIEEEESYFKHKSSASLSVSMKSLIEQRNEEKLRQSELISLRSQVSKLESMLASANAAKSQEEIEHKRLVENLKLEFQAELDKYKEGRNKLLMMAKREEDLNDKFTEYKKSAEKERKKLEEQITTLQKEKLKMENDHDENYHQSRAKISELKKEAHRYKMELELSQAELKDLQEEIDSANKKRNDTYHQLQQLEDYKMAARTAENKVKELEDSLSQYDENSILNKTRAVDLERLPQIERENRKLREENQYLKDTQENILICKEEILGLKQKLARAEKRCTELQTLQIEHEALQQKLKKWELENEAGQRVLRSPSELTRRVTSLQQSNEALLEKNGQLQSSARSCEQSLKISEQNLQETKATLLKEQEKLKQSTDLGKRMQKKLLLVIRERDGYKDILDSYESEQTVKVDVQVNKRIQLLEETVEGCRRQSVSVEEELEKCKEELSAYRLKAATLEQKVFIDDVPQIKTSVTQEADQKIISQLREELAECSKKLEKCLTEKEALEDTLEQRHLQGDFDPRKTKIVHLSMNPFSMAQKQKANEVNQLREENEKLRERVKLLEESGGEIEDLTVKVEKNLQQPSSSKEIEEMKAQVAKADLKNQRLMEAFKKTSQELREVFCHLLGFRIDVLSTNQYKLMNMYAESQNDYLLFQKSNEGEMLLLETAYSKQLGEKLEMYLQQGNSIPAFLSSITMDLFQTQTVLSTTSSFLG